jgi:hypothetical protein
MRTQVGDVVLSSNGKWCVKLETWSGQPGDEHLHSVVTSAPRFLTEDAALEAGARALDYLEQAGYFPDMTKDF